MTQIRFILIFGLVSLSFGGFENNLPNSFGIEDLVKLINEIKADNQFIKEEYQKLKKENEELKHKITELDNQLQVLNLYFHVLTTLFQSISFTNFTCKRPAI